MPIVVRREQGADLLGLARQAGTAAGTRQRQERQQVFDQQFIQQALSSGGGSRGPYGSNPGDFGYTGRAQGGREAIDYPDVVTTNGQDNQAERVRGLQLDAEESAARAAATALRDRRELFKQALAAQEAGQPDALAQFLAADAMATKGEIPSQLMDALVTDPEERARMESDRLRASRGQGAGAARTGVSQFQRDAESGIQRGEYGSLEYLTQKGKPEYEPGATAPRSFPTQEAMQARAGFAAELDSMDLARMLAARQSIAGGTLSATAKAEAVQMLDARIAEKQKLEDTTNREVYENWYVPAISKLQRSPAFIGGDRITKLRLFSKMIKDVSKQSGVDPAVLDDWVRRTNTEKDRMQDIQQGVIPPPGRAPPPNQPAGAGPPRPGPRAQSAAPGVGQQVASAMPFGIGSLLE